MEQGQDYAWIGKRDRARGKNGMVIDGLLSHFLHCYRRKGKRHGGTDLTDCSVVVQGWLVSESYFSCINGFRLDRVFDDA